MKGSERMALAKLSLAEDLSDLRGSLNSRGAMFCFSGFMTEGVLTGVANALRQKLKVEDTDRKTAKGLFSVFVELMQNVIRYSAENETCSTDTEVIDLRYGIIVVGRENDRYYVSCGNVISNNDVPRLSKGLSEILELDREGLKALYKKTLKGETPEFSKGAGVGFMEIARHTSDGFEFEFKLIDNEHSFFAIRAIF